MNNTNNKKLIAAGVSFAVAAAAYMLYLVLLSSERRKYGYGMSLSWTAIATLVSLVLVAVYCLALWKMNGVTVVYVLGIGLLGITNLFIFVEVFLFSRGFLFGSSLMGLFELVICFGIAVICFFLVLYKLIGKRPPLPLSLIGGLLYVSFVLMYVIQGVGYISYLWFYIFIIVFEIATAVGLLVLAFDSQHYALDKQTKGVAAYGGYQQPSTTSLEDELKYLKSQYELGNISAEEYEIKRRAVLNKLN